MRYDKVSSSSIRPTSPRRSPARRSLSAIIPMVASRSPMRGTSLPYRTFDTAALGATGSEVVENKRLDDVLALVPRCRRARATAQQGRAGRTGQTRPYVRHSRWQPEHVYQSAARRLAGAGFYQGSAGHRRRSSRWQD
ncbi:hypothetical protein F2981_21080 (plasmid) [Sinorhizobium meliloti]|nr:hypothetical protein [Sinorhizobium meliloti]